MREYLIAILCVVGGGCATTSSVSYAGLYHYSLPHSRGSFDYDLELRDDRSYCLTYTFPPGVSFGSPIAIDEQLAYTDSGTWSIEGSALVLNPPNPPFGPRIKLQPEYHKNVLFLIEAGVLRWRLEKKPNKAPDRTPPSGVGQL